MEYSKRYELQHTTPLNPQFVKCVCVVAVVCDEECQWYMVCGYKVCVVCGTCGI
jgi:hypothetical protein